MPKKILTPLNLDMNAEPSPAPASGVLLYDRTLAGRKIPKYMGTDGVDRFFQDSFAFGQVAMVAPASGTTAASAQTAHGTAYTNSGTISNPNVSSGSKATALRYTQFATAGTSGSLAYHRQNVLMTFRGNAAGMGGFFFSIDFGLKGMVAGNRMFVGMNGTIANPANVDPTTDFTVAKIGMAINANSGNWKIGSSSTAAATFSDLGANFAVNIDHIIRLVLFCAPNDSTVYYYVKNVSTGNDVNGSISSNLPANTQFMAPVAWMTNDATLSVCTFGIYKWLLQMPY